MTVFPSFLVSCLLLPASNAFTVPAASGGRLSALSMTPDGSGYGAVGQQHQQQPQFNRRPGPMDERGPSRENYSQPQPPRVRGGKRNSMADYYTDNPESYRPSNKFDQNDSFVNSPYGQANDVKRPAQGQKSGVRLERANIDQWKGEQNEQDAFIHGAYGSGGPGRYGLDINAPTGQPGQSRRERPMRQEPQARSQQDFIDSPYGNKGSPGGYDAAPDMDRRATQRAPPRRSSDPQADFANSPYGNRNGPNGFDVDIGGKSYERYQNPKQQQRQQQGMRQEGMNDPVNDFIDNHRGGNRMEYQGAPQQRGRGGPQGPQLERYDPRRDDKSRYSDRDGNGEARGGAQDFDPSRYQSRPAPRSQEQRQHEQRQQRQWGHSERDDFIHNPNGSSNSRPGQYGSPTGHGNDSGW